MAASTETCAICGAKPELVELVWWFVDDGRRTVHSDCWIAEYERTGGAAGSVPCGR